MEITHLASNEHLGRKPVSVPVWSITLSQQGSIEPVLVKDASKAQFVPYRACIPVGFLGATEPVLNAPGFQEDVMWPSV